MMLASFWSALLFLSVLMLCCNAGVHQQCPMSWSFVQFPCSTLSFAPEHCSLQQPSADDYRFEGCGLFVIDWLLLHCESESAESRPEECHILSILTSSPDFTSLVRRCCGLVSANSLLPCRHQTPLSRSQL